MRDSGPVTNIIFLLHSALKFHRCFISAGCEPEVLLQNNRASGSEHHQNEGTSRGRNLLTTARSPRGRTYCHHGLPGMTFIKVATKFHLIFHFVGFWFFTVVRKNKVSIIYCALLRGFKMWLNHHFSPITLNWKSSKNYSVYYSMNKFRKVKSSKASPETIILRYSGCIWQLFVLKNGIRTLFYLVIHRTNFQIILRNVGFGCNILETKTKCSFIFMHLIKHFYYWWLTGESRQVQRRDRKDGVPVAELRNRGSGDRCPSACQTDWCQGQEPQAHLWPVQSGHQVSWTQQHWAQQGEEASQVSHFCLGYLGLGYRDETIETLWPPPAIWPNPLFTRSGVEELGWSTKKFY